MDFYTELWSDFFPQTEFCGFCCYNLKQEVICMGFHNVGKHGILAASICINEESSKNSWHTHPCTIPAVCWTVLNKAFDLFCDFATVIWRITVNCHFSLRTRQIIPINSVSRSSTVWGICMYIVQLNYTSLLMLPMRFYVIFHTAIGKCSNTNWLSGPVLVRGR